MKHTERYHDFYAFHLKDANYLANAVKEKKEKKRERGVLQNENTHASMNMNTNTKVIKAFLIVGKSVEIVEVLVLIKKKKKKNLLSIYHNNSY